MAVPGAPRARRSLLRSGGFAAPLLAAAVLATPVSAAPAPALTPDGPGIVQGGSRLVATNRTASRALEVSVYSAAMRQDIALTVLPAKDPAAPAPVLYLLNGSSGGDLGSSWLEQTDVLDFLAGEQVTVVIPNGGAGSYYADWRIDDPLLGRQRWTTFLTRELPPIVDAAFHGTGANAVAGISMAATSALQLAVAEPGLYRAVGSYSGCVRISDPRGQAAVAAVVGRWGGDPVNMWGPFTDPAWSANDAYLHADRLRGTLLHITTGTGLPGPLDTVDPARDTPGELLDRITVGGVLEAITDECTHQLRDRLTELEIPATFDFRPAGTHSWAYWEQDLHNSWPLFRDALAGQ
ncbi:alpha/beta hydrolase [Nocardia asteroides]|uniref:alpha/beta hydrolase n=1 Tax=Nocardia asteroides TaxID=1824 RepID=UPI001E387693|nr:alpha/beta hydrolase family protein [Nocardia asteroides]UGT62670.1 esterase family protein [Nocardia asteroides]